VNVAGFEVTNTPLSVPNRTLKGGAIPLLGGAGKELSGFLSLVTGLLEKIPALTTGQIEQLPSTSPEGIGVAVKEKSKDSTAELNRVTRIHKVEEQSAPLQLHSALELAVIANLPVAFESPKLASESMVGNVKTEAPDGNTINIGSVQHPTVTPNDVVNVEPLTVALPVPTRPSAGVAFVLRLIPNNGEIRKDPLGVIAAAHPTREGRSSGAGPEPYQEKSDSGSETNLAAGSTTLSCTTSEKPEETSPAFQISPVVRQGLTTPPEPTLPISDPRPSPKNIENATAAPSTLLSKPGTERIAATPHQVSDVTPYQSLQSEPRWVSKGMSDQPGPAEPRQVSDVTPDQQRQMESRQVPSVVPNEAPKSESRVVAGIPVDTLLKPADGGAKTNSLLPPNPSSRPLPTPLQEATVSQLGSKEPKPEPAEKRESLAPRLNDRHVEGNAAASETPARLPDHAASSDTRVARAAGTDSPELKVASEPETRVAIATSPTRQISLKLSTNDSTRVNVDLTERAGKVQVAVRTSDHELAKSLQVDLGDLVGRLENKGFKTEAWIPAAAHQTAGPSQSSNSNTGFGQPQHSASGDGQQRQQQNGANQRQPRRWKTQLDQTMSANESKE
jgi:hypothetical protein